jgi:hypothetical protein
LSKLDEALAFLREKSLDSVINNPNIAPEFKNKYVHVNELVRRFRRIGDLYQYMERYEKVEGELTPWEKAVNNVGPTLRY